MKSIEQLIALKNNPYYVFEADEQKALDDFLSQKSEPQRRAKSNGKVSEKNIPATVINKNVVAKETGEIPTESAAVEEAVHPDAVK